MKTKQQIAESHAEKIWNWKRCEKFEIVEEFLAALNEFEAQLKAGVVKGICDWVRNDIKHTFLSDYDTDCLEHEINYLLNSSLPHDSVESQRNEQPDWKQKIADFVLGILHGDEVHKAWLREAGEAFITGKPLPPPRDAKGSRFVCCYCGRGAQELTTGHLSRVNRLGDLPAVWICSEHKYLEPTPSLSHDSAESHPSEETGDILVRLRAKQLIEEPHRTVFTIDRKQLESIIASLSHDTTGKKDLVEMGTVESQGFRMRNTDSTDAVKSSVQVSPDVVVVKSDLFDAIEEFVTGLVDGALDASPTNKMANMLSREIEIARNESFGLYGSILIEGGTRTRDIEQLLTALDVLYQYASDGGSFVRPNYAKKVVEKWLDHPRAAIMEDEDDARKHPWPDSHCNE